MRKTEQLSSRVKDLCLTVLLYAVLAFFCGLVLLEAIRWWFWVNQ
jgi:hypothetical protein